MNRCRFCGLSVDDGTPFDAWVRDTFTNHDKLYPGSVVCDACLFWLDEASVELQQRLGLDKPQRMRNYSHFIVAGEWIPLSKAEKWRMRQILLGVPFPKLAVIAVSGQKHLVFRARWNDEDAAAGWVQFEEAPIFVEPKQLAAKLDVVDALYQVFTKSEIATGHYAMRSIQQFGIERFMRLEATASQWRGQPLFDLALFLAQRSDENGD